MSTAAGVSAANPGLPSDPADKLTLLERRELEARIVGPLVRGFMREVGAARALEVVRGVIVELARNSGADLARRLGESSLAAFASCLDAWSAGGALEIEILERSGDRLDFNVTRCRYAELYRALGLEDLGASLSCARDFALAEGFSPDIELARTQTIMEGAAHCDFRFRARRRAGEIGVNASADS